MSDEVARAAAQALHDHLLAHAPPGARPDPVAVEEMTRVVLNAAREEERKRKIHVHLTPDPPSAPGVNRHLIAEAYERGRRGMPPP